MALEAGTRLGHYEVVSSLGAGGMGEVYLAEDSELQRKVALKLLPEDLASDPDRLQRFRREARTVAKLNHPNIVTIHSVEEAEGLHFLTMELVKGRRLTELIPTGGLPLGKLFDLAIPLADAVSSAHRLGITHRDLKPDNVMVTREGNVKVLDFGLAKMTDLPPGAAVATQLPTATITEGGKILGTVAYMSPEQAEGKQVDHRSDVFSLGIIIYEMATGERPFAGDSSAQVISSILRDTPRSIDELRGELPHHLGRIIRRCLEKDPERRVQLAKDIRNELEDLRQELAEERVAKKDTALDASPSGDPDRKTRRKWVIGLTAGSLAVAILFLLVYLKRSPPAAELQAGAPITKIMLAVLPFTNMSPDPDQEYFSDGLTEEMIAHLGSLRPERLGVIARTSAMRYKGTDKAIDEIGRDLGVDYLLEGSVRREGGRVRINTQLIQVSDQTNLWAQSYERSLEDVFGIQNEIAGHIARSLMVELLPVQQSALEEAAPVDPEAYDAYLKGWYFWNKLTAESLEQSLEHFRRSIELAPDYAWAYYGLAAAYHMQASSDWVPDREAYPLAKEAALKALDLDDRLAGAHASLGFITYLYDWDWQGAERAFQRALELNPNSDAAHHMYGLYLRSMGRFEEAVAEMKRAAELDPLSLLGMSNLGRALALAGHYQEAIGQFQDLLELSPAFDSAHLRLGDTYWMMGKWHEAIGEFETAVELSPSPRNAAALGFYYASLGRREEATQILDRLTDEHVPPGEYVPPVHVATIHAALGDKDRAFALLEEAYRQRDDDLVRLKVDPKFDGLRSDPRFQDLLRRMNFPH